MEQVKPHLVVVGDPVSGFEFTGPFESHDEATEWAEAEIRTDSWWIAPMVEPYGPEPAVPTDIRAPQSDPDWG